MKLLSCVVCLLFLLSIGENKKAWGATKSVAESSMDSLPTFPLGTKWTYEYVSSGWDPNVTNYGFIVYEVTDTIHVNDTTIYIITNDRNSGSESMIQMDGKVWFLVGGLNNWQLTYDFDATDRYTTLVDPTLETEVVIDSIVSFIFGNRGEQKLQHVSIIQNFTWEDPLEVSILEGCGNLTGGMDSGLRLGMGLNLWDPFPWYNIGKLRCFEQGEFFFNFSDSETGEIACDSMWTVVRGNEGKQLVRSDVEWIERETYMTSPSSTTTRFRFSEVEYTFDTRVYRELLFNHDELNDDFEGTERYFREENQQVIEYANNREYLMYDFDPEDGQVITLESLNWTGGIPFGVTLDYHDPIELMNGEVRNVIGLICPHEDEPEQYWIEGIGSPLGFLDAYLTCYTDRNTQLRCFFRNDTLLYKNPNIAECWVPSSTRDLPQIALGIWPNPTNNEVHIETKVPFDRVRIFSVLGKQVGEYTGEIVTLSLTILESGLYFIQVEQKGRILAVERVVKVD